MKGFITGFLLACAIYGLGCQAQQSPQSNGRYTIYQSPLLARQTFLLDTTSGTVHSLVVDQDNRYWWELNQVQGITRK